MTPYFENFWNNTWDDWIENIKVNVFTMYSLCSAFIT